MMPTRLQNSIRATMLAAAAGLCCSFAAADTPEALARVAPDAPLIVSIGDVGAFFAQAESLTAAIQQDEAAAGIAEARRLFGMPGVDTDGSAALVFNSLDLEGDTPPMVALIPVEDYNQLVTELGGTGEGTELLQFQGEDVHIRDLGDGFAAIAPQRDLLDAFQAVENAGDAHSAVVGSTGRDLLEDHTVVVIADVAAFGPALLEGWEESQQGMRMMGQMTGQGEQIDQQIETVTLLLNSFARDGQRGMLGLSAGDSGISVEAAASFKEGSEIAGFFQDSGEAANLAERLPGGPYLFAMAMDTSSDGAQRLLSNASNLGGNQMPGLDFSQFFEGANGFATVVGMNPAGIMGGMFVNTTAIMDVDDADTFINTYGDSLRAMNDQTANGVTTQTQFAETPQQIAGVDAYRWQVKMLPDLDTPGAQQMQMMMPMLFGPTGGPSGYLAAASNDTVVMTYSTNSSAVSNAVKAAREGGTLASDMLFRQQAERLHEEAVMVAYVDAGSILRTVLPFAAMFAGPVDVEVPEAVTPIAMSMAADDGSMTFRTVVPTDVIDLFAQLGEAFEGMNEGNDFDDGGDPQF
ncbi:MAG: hypothetical protein AAGF47_08370 [Planctomycetota bacterium]